MLEAVVLAAELLTLGWFLVFSGMLLSMYLDSRGMELPRLDGIGRSLILNARLAFAAGGLALLVLALVEFDLV
ncbi:hypothetical protein GWI72_12160 [Microvirga tunisiensis]|uniref:Uncharacterized protein n=1 Tax=Pannonibacter tanglangensis TaxID=2750084 RepID=A0A7X5F3D5_9HYPH|nr:hypothetical protein [Pannonibacter sp. XCT-53]NBN79023.1 hypothetical protein [Pannonibacter sp. XCT-53]